MLDIFYVPSIFKHDLRYQKWSVCIQMNSANINIYSIFTCLSLNHFPSHYHRHLSSQLYLSSTLTLRTATHFHFPSFHVPYIHKNDLIPHPSHLSHQVIMLASLLSRRPNSRLFATIEPLDEQTISLVSIPPLSLYMYSTVSATK